MKAKILQRVWAEVHEVNADFFNLRTIISPDPEDNATQFYYMMLPNDGAMAHLTLVGRLIIPEGYPEAPPIVQLFTPTSRYNVDVYRSRLESNRSSTMCFDILRSKSDGGAWQPEYTLSCLFASLMSAIVSFYVAQQGGGEKEEYVSMEKLDKIKSDARSTYNQHKDSLPDIPRIPLVDATAVPAKNLFEPQEFTAGSPARLTSAPIYLQGESNEVYSFAVDLSRLNKDVVFSVILSNSKRDIIGRERDTVLIRNGVTATAARKLAGKSTMWFYHGKPLNDGDMQLHVTIGRDQMTFVYYEDGRRYVHGDCPVSRLSAEHIGDVRGVPFYVHIYTKVKTGDRANPVTIDLLDIKETGYIHELVGEEERTDFGFEHVKHSDAVEPSKQNAGWDEEWDVELSKDISKMTL